MVIYFHTYNPNPYGNDANAFPERMTLRGVFFLGDEGDGM